jgi:hypothetical protein
MTPKLRFSQVDSNTDYGLKESIKQVKSGGAVSHPLECFVKYCLSMTSKLMVEHGPFDPGP